MVLRAANQNELIADGNHTIIPSAISRPPRCEYNLCGKKSTSQRNRRERPVCRSGGRFEYNPCGQNGISYRHVIPGSEASRGIFSSCRFYPTQVIIATWEDPSTPFHFGRDDMSIGDTIHPYRLYGTARNMVSPNVAAMIHRHMQRNE